MDELQMVRDSYPEPAPPTDQEVARVKALLNESRQLNESRRRAGSRLRWGLGGAVAVGTAAILTITLVGGDRPATPGPVNLDDKGAILAAAVMAESTPVGKYWYSDQINGQSYIMRAKTGTYAITGAHSEAFWWFGAKSGTGEAFYGRDLPARPSSAADAALWRKAGSPSSFRVWSNDHYWSYTTKASTWVVDHPDASGGGESLDGKSVADLQSLPTDPATLAKMFLSPLNSQQGRAQILKVVRLLQEDPLPPKVRAGLMRALAAQPGVHAIGTATDPLGRRGVALAADPVAITISDDGLGVPKSEQGTYRSRAVIIFDERTGALLSEQEELTTPGGAYSEMKPGFIINYSAARSARWIDAIPKPPAGLPLG